MPKSRSSFPAPGRVFLPGCALAAGLLLISSATHAAPAKPASIAAAPAMKLSVGKTVTYQLPARATFVVEAGALNVVTENRDGTLYLKAVRAGEVRLRIRTPDDGARLVVLQLVESPDAAPAPTGQGFGSKILLPAANLTQPTTVAIEIPSIALDAPQSYAIGFVAGRSARAHCGRRAPTRAAWRRRGHAAD